MSEIEHNVAEIKDFTIPLFKLQQKVEKLENSFNSFLLETTSVLAEQVSHKFN